MMNPQAQKLELIRWIVGLNDPKSLRQVAAIKEHSNRKRRPAKRHFGGGKHIIIDVADDFNAPLDAFGEYMP